MFDATRGTKLKCLTLGDHASFRSRNKRWKEVIFYTDIFLKFDLHCVVVTDIACEWKQRSHKEWIILGSRTLLEHNCQLNSSTLQKGGKTNLTEEHVSHEVGNHHLMMEKQEINFPVLVMKDERLMTILAFQIES